VGRILCALAMLADALGNDCCRNHSIGAAAELLAGGVRSDDPRR
jgi:hypothetical protein